MDKAVTLVFDSFGGAESLLGSSRDVCLKVNGIDFKPHVYTSLEKGAPAWNQG